ncbi:hypothetical protein CVT25_004147 [Psilocybe cyanescens]|uniref:Uncharacterized protein n=1 Tax=Psilocybe cyanescens TaxID=93625 RepID=A0A409XKX3_PSICY|nr:hypothetical protein CVT25_004147 [Psilocybe cyanescens]
MCCGALACGVRQEVPRAGLKRSGVRISGPLIVAGGDSVWIGRASRGRQGSRDLLKLQSVSNHSAISQCKFKVVLTPGGILGDGRGQRRELEESEEGSYQRTTCMKGEEEREGRDAMPTGVSAAHEGRMLLTKVGGNAKAFQSFASRKI